MKQNIKFIKSETVAEATMAFYFEKPADFDFAAGQSGDFTLINPVQTDAEGNVRTFSFITAPHENILGIATRMRDTAFKNNLKEFKAGDEIMMDAPYGDLKLHNNAAKPAVFLTGGIGITPVRSIILDAIKKGLPHQIYLFYSNRRPEDTAFLQELVDLQNGHQNYKFIGTMTQPEKSAMGWNGETGYIDGQMLKKYITNLSESIYYLTGPQSMVTAMRSVLADLGVDSDNIKTEEFAGY